MGSALEGSAWLGDRSAGLASDVADEVPRTAVASGKEQLALENTLRLAEEIGPLDGTAEQIIDSTPMLGAAATQDTVRLVRHGVRKLTDAVAALDAGAGWRLDDGVEFDYARARMTSLIAAGARRLRASGC